MSRPLQSMSEVTAAADAASGARPVVIVGNGPVGMHVARQLLQHLPASYLLIYGDERHAPYDRVRLSSCLAGEVDPEDLQRELEVPASARVEQRLGCRIAAIDPERRLVHEAAGVIQPYDKLILATGSRPHVPDLPGIGLPGVYTFRDLDDTTRLIARRAQSRHTVVLGGGLLGLETARGMQQGATRVTVVEHADRLLGRQLDESAAQQLAATVEALGIEVVIGDGVRRVLGEAAVEGVELLSGRTLPCDTLVVATGIRSNVDLARSAGLAFGRGVRVDDAMQTSAEHVYAVGECAEHRGRVYGVVAPGLEQAAVAAAHIAGLPSRYQGSIAAAWLKVVGVPVFSVGPMGAGEDHRYGKTPVYRAEPGVYRKLLVRRNRLAGALALGECAEAHRLQTAVAEQALVWPWQMWRFRRTGQLWPADQASGVLQWPLGATVCQCTGVTRGAIGRVIATGSCSLARVSDATGAATVCGSCRPLIRELLGDANPPEPAAWWRTLLGLAGFSLLLVAALVFAPAVPYADSVAQAWRWDWLWRDGLAKQVSGFTVLGLFVLGLLVSPRKRLRRLQRLGGFDAWRLAHLVLGVLALLALVAHTGLRLGHGLNGLLLAAFAATLALGGATTVVLALEHRIGPGAAQRWRRRALWWHILLFWPVPALLGFHVLKTYWY